MVQKLDLSTFANTNKEMLRSHTMVRRLKGDRSSEVDEAMMASRGRTFPLSDERLTYNRVDKTRMPVTATLL